MVKTTMLDLPSVVVTSGAENDKVKNNKIEKIVINFKWQKFKTMVRTKMLDSPSVVVSSAARKQIVIKK